MDNIYVSTRFGHGSIASGMWDQQHSQLLWNSSLDFYLRLFAYFLIYLPMEKKKSGKNPAVRLLFESVRW